MFYVIRKVKKWYLLKDYIYCLWCRVSFLHWTLFLFTFRGIVFLWRWTLGSILHRERQRRWCNLDVGRLHSKIFKGSHTNMTQDCGGDTYLGVMKSLWGRTRLLDWSAAIRYCSMPRERWRADCMRLDYTGWK